MHTHWPAIKISLEERLRKIELLYPANPYFNDYKLIKLWKKKKSHNGYMIVRKYVFVKR